MNVESNESMFFVFLFSLTCSRVLLQQKKKTKPRNGIHTFQARLTKLEIAIKFCPLISVYICVNHSNTIRCSLFNPFVEYESYRHCENIFVNNNNKITRICWKMVRFTGFTEGLKPTISTHNCINSVFFKGFVTRFALPLLFH